MKLSEIPMEELELMGYDDIAYLVLQESGKKMKLIDIFKKINKILNLPDENVENHLVDFFELMSTNKKFIMLKNGYWDLQNRHAADIVIEENDDEEYETEVDDENSITEATDSDDENIFYEQEDETEDAEEDDLADLVVINGDEEDEQNN